MKSLQPYEQPVCTFQLQHARHASFNMPLKSCAPRQNNCQINAATTSPVWHHLSIILLRMTTLGTQEQRGFQPCSQSHRKIFRTFFPLCFTQVPQDHLFLKSAVTGCFS